MFPPDLSQQPPLSEQPPLAAAEIAQRLHRARHEFQQGLLKWLKNDPAGIAKMKSAAAAVELTQSQGGTRAFWWATLGLLEALAEGSIAVDNEVKRLCARIEGQMRKLQQGSPDVTSVDEQLMRDVLYRVALASPGSEQVERVRKAYRLDECLPALHAMRDTLGAAREEWDRCALPQFDAHATALVGQAKALAQVDLSRLTAALAASANMLAREPQRRDESVALEIASALLLAENALNGFAHLGIAFAHQVDIMTGRLAALQRGADVADLQPGGTILSTTIYDLFLAEARAHLDTLERELQLHAKQPPTAEMIRAADTLGGISDTIGRAPIKVLALALGRALARMSGHAAAPDNAGHALLEQAVNALREMTEAVALRRLPEARDALVAALDGLAPVQSQ